MIIKDIICLNYVKDLGKYSVFLASFNFFHKNISGIAFLLWFYFEVTRYTHPLQENYSCFDKCSIIIVSARVSKF